MAKLNAKKAEAQLIEFAHTMPEAWEDHPWDHTVLKVGKKIFVFFGGAAGPKDTMSVTVKLPISAEMALTLPDTKPAGHGLGKAGWIQMHRKTGEDIDIDLIQGWIVQSYKAVAPKKFAKLLGVETPAPAPVQKKRSRA
jgi:predicted DNA-binding protein (MmcQ/YjbR family)